MDVVGCPKPTDLPNMPACCCCCGCWPNILPVVPPMPLNTKDQKCWNDNFIELVLTRSRGPKQRFLLLLLLLLLLTEERSSLSCGCAKHSSRLSSGSTWIFPASRIIFITQFFQRFVLVLFHGGDTLVMRIDVSLDVVPDLK